VQWYANVPAVWNVNEKRPPGVTVPELQAFPSDVDVCVIASLFIHVTVSPTDTFTMSGAYARSPSDSAPAGIETDVEPLGVGVGTADGDEVELPHAAAKTTAATTTARRTDDITFSTWIDRRRQSRSVRRRWPRYRFMFDC
jgi:hypothetical protein